MIGSEPGPDHDLSG